MITFLQCLLFLVEIFRVFPLMYFKFRQGNLFLFHLIFIILALKEFNYSKFLNGQLRKYYNFLSFSLYVFLNHLILDILHYHLEYLKLQINTHNVALQILNKIIFPNIKILLIVYFIIVKNITFVQIFIKHFLKYSSRIISQLQ